MENWNGQILNLYIVGELELLDLAIQQKRWGCGAAETLVAERCCCGMARVVA
ncbi:MAG: hypothetical protein OXT74_10315 [Candidatus Poribacteria bacterium]|nr:hypothetical protein [Candidatus Poribacteria bacterium]